MERCRRLFAFEGIDGSGKTTQINFLREKMQKEGFPIFVSKACTENDKKEISEFREKLGIEKRSVAMMLLFHALQVRQCEKTLASLHAGKIVLADRWNASFRIYHQNFGPLKDAVFVLNILEKIAFQGLKPEITFFLDLPVELAMARKKQNGRDLFDDESFDVYSTARRSYLNLAIHENDWIVVDASQSIDEMYSFIWGKLSEHLKSTE